MNKCPICGQPVEPGSRYTPFCSERCRTIDLGNWAAEKYCIAGRPQQSPPDTEDENKDRGED